MKEAKRRARDSDRAFAAELARLYRARHPRDAFCGKTASTDWRGPDIGDALEWFAEHGTWDKSAAQLAPWNAMAYRLYFDRKRAKGISSEDAIAELVEEYQVSDRTIRGAIYGKRSGKG